MSRGFLCTLFGIAITAFGWIAPGWLLPGGWPAWPGFLALRLAFGKHGADYLELSYAARATTLVVLIVINIATWALLAWLATIAITKVRGKNASA